MNQIEIEKTYLAKDVPAQYLSGDMKKIVDLYIGDNIRVRHSGDKYEFTKKIEINGQLERQEINVPLEKGEFELLSKAASIRLEKTRYYYDLGGHILEIDLWEGEFFGIVTVEIEFNSVDESKDFNAPEFCFKEVTEDSHGSLYKCLVNWKKYYS